MLELILLQVITFAVVIAVLHFLFGSQLKVALNRLQVLHQESLEKEEILNKELERAKVQVDAEIARSKEEAKHIIENAKQSAERVGREAAERAQVEAKKLIDEAQERSKRLESEVLASVDEKAVGLSQELIRYIFTQEDQKVLHVHLIDELIEELKKIDKARLAVQAQHAEVLTSWPLSTQEKQDLEEVLTAKLGREIPVEEKSDPSLIFGIVIRLGGLVVDGSLKNKLARAVQAMRSKKL
jgi:F0F1-type ATP synthase delta subunit